MHYYFTHAMRKVSTLSHTSKLNNNLHVYHEVISKGTNQNNQFNLINSVGSDILLNSIEGKLCS